jgi:predicted DNA binding CopG/RHH family protein
MIAPNETGNGNKYNLSRKDFEKLKRKAEARGMTVEEYVDQLLREHLNREEEQEE